MKKVSYKTKWAPDAAGARHFGFEWPPGHSDPSRPLKAFAIAAQNRAAECTRLAEVENDPKMRQFLKNLGLSWMNEGG